MSLSSIQEQVLAAIAGGANQIAAAAAANIHRNSIGYWRRTSPEFHHAFSQALYDKALFIREKAEELVDDAFAVLRDILKDPKASPSVRLRAAQFILDKACTPPKADAPPKTKENGVHKEETMHKNAQKQAEPAETVHKPVVQTVHNPAQTIRRERPKIGRNEACPCRSGMKFKHCCIDKPHPATLAA